MKKEENKKSLTSKWIFPAKYAFSLLIPIRNIFISPDDLLERLDLKSDYNVLEVWAWPWYFSKTMAEVLQNWNLVLADIQKEMIKKSKARLKKYDNVWYYLCDWKKFDLESNHFDIIFMVTVIWEVENKDEYIKEFYRMLKKWWLLSISEQAWDPDKMSTEELHELITKHWFKYDKQYWNEKNFTINFIKI